MHKNHVTVGLFDSGVGGLSVLRQLESYFKVYPQARNYRFIYLGDTARCPYGNRSAGEIKSFVAEIVGFLDAKGADMIVMACNTSAALALDHARTICQKPVFDLISPVSNHLAKNFAGSKIAVLATQATVKSQAFAKAIAHENKNLQVVEIACPELVHLVESGDLNSNNTIFALSKYADRLKQEEVEAVVLGCTHYPFLAGTLSSLLPENIQLIDPAAIMVRSLSHDHHLSDFDNNAQPEIITETYATGDAASFAKSAEICLGHSLGTVYGITVEDLEPMANPRPFKKPELETVADISTAI